MQSKLHYECLPFLIVGIYMIVMGAVSKTLIDESEMPATEEEKAQKPTSIRRVLVILGGVGCITYSLLCMRH
jgi:hypothetical protein